MELAADKVDPIEIATYEYGEDAIPITVVRKLPSEKRAAIRPAA